MFLQRLAVLVSLTLLPILAEARFTLYVGNAGDGTVSVMDAGTSTVTATIATGAGPSAIAALPDGRRAYVVNGTAGTVSVVDTFSNSVSTTIVLQIAPTAIVVNPAGTRAYIANSGSDTVSIISTASNALIATQHVSQGPQGVAVNPNGRWVYAFGAVDGNVSVIDADSNFVVDTVHLGNGPTSSAFSPDALTMYVSGADGLLVVDVPSVRTTRTITNAQLLVAGRLGQVLLNPKGDALYAMASTGNSADLWLLAIDPKTLFVINRIQVGKNNAGLAIDPTGARLYVTNQANNTVAVIDAGTLAILANVPVRAGPLPLAFFDAAEAPAPFEVIEYYNAALDHYFITWVPSEIAALDANTTIKGWTQTGKSLKTWVALQAGTSPVCRFYIRPAQGDSHFFGRGTAECNATAQKNPTFVLEDPAFMQMYLPVAGVCPANTTPVYRVFSNRLDANHRYMTDAALRDQMVAMGWLAEGDGPDRVVMCAPK